jgi:homoserine O-acetyltransferase
VRGLRTARKIAMLTYKSDALLRERHGRRRDRAAGDRDGAGRFDVEGYLEHQADLFESRMDAATYATLSHAMDSFNAREEARLAPPAAPSLHFVSISSDWLFRPDDIRAAAARFAQLNYTTSYCVLHSDHGHDAFLAEDAALAALLRTTLSTASITTSGWSN